MTTRYSAPSVEAIQEDSEDESRDGLGGNSDQNTNRHSYRRSRMAPAALAAAVKEKERERPRRKHRSKEGHSKQQSRSQGKSSTMKRANGCPTRDRDSGSEEQRTRHRRTFSNRSTSSTPSSSEEDEPIQDHREVLAAARAKLTSPSMISTFTSLTTSTNKSSGSSGSNSTVTQASVTKRSSMGKRTEMSDAPLSPAVPDPPNVFAFLDNPIIVGTTHEEGEGEEEEHDVVQGDIEEEDEEPEAEEHESQWPSVEDEPALDATALLSNLSPKQTSARESSSSSSSFHGSEHCSEPIADNDTDRSTSPELSIKDHASDHEPEPATPRDRASARMASQMAAAHQRQNLYGSMQNFGTPNMPRGNATLPHRQSTALSPRHIQHVQQHSLPRAEKLPVTGYELLATRLSSQNSSSEFEDGTVIKPIYRKFAALNHRLLLHLQDELSELEEQLHRLDHADTQSRWAGPERRVIPASRRVAAMQGGDLQWHKTDVLGKIGFKLAQYSSSLSRLFPNFAKNNRSSPLFVQRNAIPLTTRSHRHRNVPRVLIYGESHRGSRDAFP